jgi:hypothetical protein
MTNKNKTLELKIQPRVVLRAPCPNDTFFTDTLKEITALGLVHGKKNIKNLKSIMIFI